MDNGKKLLRNSFIAHGDDNIEDFDEDFLVNKLHPIIMRNEPIE